MYQQVVHLTNNSIVSKHHFGYIGNKAAPRNYTNSCYLSILINKSEKKIFLDKIYKGYSGFRISQVVKHKYSV